MTPKCPACGSESFSGASKVVQPKGLLGVNLKNPKGGFLLDTETANFTHARICLSCGYVMLFVLPSVVVKLRKGELVPVKDDD